MKVLTVLLLCYLLAAIVDPCDGDKRCERLSHAHQHHTQKH